MTRAGAGAKTSQVLHQVCLTSPSTMTMTPCSLFLSACRVQFVFQKETTLRVGHSPFGCKDHKENLTIEEVRLAGNRIGDRGRAALEDAVQALHITVFFWDRPCSLLPSQPFAPRTHMFCCLPAAWAGT